MFPPPELGSSTRPASPRPPAFITPRRSSLGTGPSPSSESSSSSPSTTRIFVAIRPTPVPPDVPSGGFLPGKLLDGSRAFSSPPTPPTALKSSTGTRGSRRTTTREDEPSRRLDGCRGPNLERLGSEV